jgi:hypothetical protein
VQEVTSGIIGWRAAGVGGRTSIKTSGIPDLRRRSTAWKAWLEALRGGDASGGTGKQKRSRRERASVETGAVGISAILGGSTLGGIGVIGDALWEPGRRRE